MAGDLTKDANLRFKGPVYTEQFLLDTAAAVKVYRGQPMLIDVNVDTGHVVAFNDAAVTVASGDVCVGIACEPHNVVLNDPETQVVNVYTWPTIVGFKMAAADTFTNEDLGKKMYMSGSGTLSLTATGNPFMGYVYSVEDWYCYVKLSTPQICAG
jgi:Flp pilus assembly protein TadG